MANRDEVVITAQPLPLGALAARVVCPTAGAIATFIGTTRDNFEGKRVLRLEYEAYQPMAEREMLAIIRAARARWELRHVAIAHRTGIVPEAEASVEIAISSAHRREALEAVQFAIDELKAKVPIWKKEVYEAEDARWKENKESNAPTIEQLTTRQASTPHARLAALAMGVAVVSLALAAAQIVNG
eukprot:CAMPEP_0115833544 /NCGR_PEP_ID=MMETSP0287-20121206/3227_1 /TAXON_ID=412157 /ORGANISM="Chrysochromulina rotalis, Strain UIO044" /LENGTH=185 /DNA_ID=CAMNT_0003286961 /DNA_START=15 /DNA_END=567 /DNA_ORIENTATION=+